MHFRTIIAIALPVIGLLAGLSATVRAETGQTGTVETLETLVKKSDNIVLAANKKRRGPKERDKEDTGKTKPTVTDDCGVQKRKGPKGDGDSGIRVQDLVDGLDAKTKPKGAVSSDAQGCAAIDPVPVPFKHRGPKGGGRDKILTD